MIGPEHIKPLVVGLVLGVACLTIAGLAIVQRWKDRRTP